MEVKSGERVQIANVANRWKKQYLKNGEWYDAVKHNIWQKLAALKVATATARDVAAIIGNDSWIGWRCDECGERVGNAVQIGDEDDTSHAVVCGPCLRTAIDLLAVVESERTTEHETTRQS